MVKKIDWDSLLPTIHQLRSEGKSTNFISKEIGVSRETLAKFLESNLGIEVRKNGPRKSAQWIGNETIKCSVCGSIKTIENYHLTKSKNPYSFCKSCYSDKEKARYRSSGVSWTKKNYDLNSSAKNRSLKYNLNPKYLEFIYGIQEGKCAYTGEKLELSVGLGHIHSGVSIDRFNTSLGYEIGNVLICSRRANTIKHNQTLIELKEWMPSWYESGLKMLGDINIAWSEFDKSALHPHQSEELK